MSGAPRPPRSRVEAFARRAVELVPMPQPPLRPTRHPVVLMHGFGALANLMQAGVLHAEAMHLRMLGVAAYAPHVNPYDTLAVRAEAWAERLGRVLDETGAARLNLVAFSSAGLEARWLAARGWAPRLASIVTVSTPHRGTALADLVLGRAELPGGARLAALARRLAVAVMDTIGRAAYEPAAPNVEAALAELAPAAVCRHFEPAHPMPEGVWCASFAGRAGRGTDVPCYPPLVPMNRLLYTLQGVNDGIVPTAGAWWGERLGTLDADHARQIGMALTASDRYDSKAFFASVCDRLRDRGL